MKARTVACISMTVGLLLTFSGCGKQQKVSVDTASQTSTILSDNNSKNVGTTATTSDTSGEDAKKVVSNYLDALGKNDINEVNKCRTQPFNGTVKVDSIKIIKIDNDVGNKQKNSYLNNKGLNTKPYDSKCFRVTYDIQYNKEDEKKATENSGEKTKWFVVVKLTKESPWLIDEIGY